MSMQSDEKTDMPVEPLTGPYCLDKSSKSIHQHDLLPTRLRYDQHKKVHLPATPKLVRTELRPVCSVYCVHSPALLTGGLDVSLYLATEMILIFSDTLCFSQNTKAEPFTTTHIQKLASQQCVGLVCTIAQYFIENL